MSLGLSRKGGNLLLPPLSAEPPTCSSVRMSQLDLFRMKLPTRKGISAEFPVKACQLQEDVLLEGTHSWAITCITSPVSGAHSRDPHKSTVGGLGTNLFPEEQPPTLAFGAAFVRLPSKVRPVLLFLSWNRGIPQWFGLKGP